MAKKLSLPAKIFKAIFMIITGFFLLLGCIVFGIGVYLQVESSNYSFITDSNYVTGAALLITSGLITIIISTVGFIGACLNLRILLAIYAIVLFIIVIFEIAAGVVGFLYSDSNADRSEETYRNRLDKAIRQYDTNSDAKKAMDSIQDVLLCCGIDSPSDWSRNGQFIWDNEQQLPESCQCTDTSNEYCKVAEPFRYNYTDANNNNMTVWYRSNNTVWTDSCYNNTVDVLITYSILWGGIGITFGILEIIGIIIAIGLIGCISCASEEGEYV